MTQATALESLSNHVASVIEEERSFEMTDKIAESIAEFAHLQRPEWDAEAVANTLTTSTRCWPDAERTVIAASYIIADPSITDFSVITRKGPWWKAAPKKI